MSSEHENSRDGQTLPRDRTGYNTDQNLLLALEALQVMKRRWFVQSIKPAPDRFMSLLLLSVYAHAMFKMPLGKKSAGLEIEAQDVKTGRKYINQAMQMGLIEVKKSPNDKRLDLLHPTDILTQIVEYELKEFADDLRHFMFGLLDYPLAETDAPLLSRHVTDEMRKLPPDHYISTLASAIFLHGDISPYSSSAPPPVLSWPEATEQKAIKPSAKKGDKKKPPR